MKQLSFVLCVLVMGAAAPQFASAEETAPETAQVVAQESAAAEEQAAATEPAAAPEQEPVNTADATKKICKYEKMTGTRFGKRVCMTQAEWDQLRKDSQEGVRNAQRNNSAPGTGQ